MKMDTLSNNLAVTLTISEMQELIRTCVSEVLQEVQPKEETERFLTRKQACEMLHISLPTLARYLDQGIVKGSKIGNRVIIDQKEINNALKDITKRKSSK